MAAWEDMTDTLTDWAKENLKVGQVLIFDFEGSSVHIKIMRKYKGKVWGKRTYLPLADEVEVKDKKTGKVLT